jgi:hypothetical protein
MVEYQGAFMDAKALLQKQIENMRYLQDSALQDLTNSQLAWVPPGTATPIGVIWLHMVATEDRFIAHLLGQPALWKSANWKEIFETEKSPNIGKDWSDFQKAALTVEKLQSYMDAARVQTDAYFESISDESLDELVRFFTASDPTADVWVLLIGHTLLHSGEIAAIKGVQGVKGLPF